MKQWITKQQYLIDFTLASLLRRKGKNLAFLLVYTFMVFLLTSVMLFSRALKQEASITLQGAPEITVQRMAAGRHDMISSAYIDVIKKIRGVSKVQGRLWGYYFDSTLRANYTLMVPDTQKINPGNIVIGNGISRTKNVFVGDIIVLRAYNGKMFSFSVTKVLSYRSEIATSDLMLLSEKDYRDFFGMASGLFTDIALTVRNSREAQTIAQKITQQLPNTRPILKSEILRTYDSIFNWREGIVFAILAGTLLAFAIFAWDKASGLSAEEKKEIGILKAVGWETSDVIHMKVWEGVILSLSSFFLGFILAYVHVFQFSLFLFEPVLKGWAVLYPYFRLTPHIDGVQLATLFFFTVFPYTVATIIPIWRVAILDPSTAMK